MQIKNLSISLLLLFLFILVYIQDFVSATTTTTLECPYGNYNMTDDSCSSAYDCCYWMCANGYCADCKPNRQLCAYDRNCCSGKCESGTCKYVAISTSSTTTVITSSTSSTTTITQLSTTTTYPTTTSISSTTISTTTISTPCTDKGEDCSSAPCCSPYRCFQIDSRFVCDNANPNGYYIYCLASGPCYCAKDECSDDICTKTWGQFCPPSPGEYYVNGTAPCSYGPQECYSDGRCKLWDKRCYLEPGEECYPNGCCDDPNKYYVCNEGYDDEIKRHWKTCEYHKCCDSPDDCIGGTRENLCCIPSGTYYNHGIEVCGAPPQTQGWYCSYGKWHDPDHIRLISYCEAMGNHPAYCGEEDCSIVGEYQDSTTLECCGDDEGEYYILGMDQTSACCDNPQNIVLKSKCIEPINLKIFLLIFNPILESYDNQRLIDFKNWNDPDQLTQQYIQDLREVSGGIVNYVIDERIEVDDFPQKIDGFNYTDETYLQCCPDSLCVDDSNCHKPEMIDYAKIFQDYDICNKVRTRGISEVWIFAGPHLGGYEFIVKGPNIDIHPENAPDCGRTVITFSFNYRRLVKEMLEDFGHLTEDLMGRVLNVDLDPENEWDKFDGQRYRYWVEGGYDCDNQPPLDTENAHCGNIHFPPNSRCHYEYWHQEKVWSDCNDWYNYPDLTGNREQIDCAEWNCDEREYKKWWFRHLPKAEGRTNGKLNNWWKYVVDYDNAIIEERERASLSITLECNKENNECSIQNCEKGLWIITGEPLQTPIIKQISKYPTITFEPITQGKITARVICFEPNIVVKRKTIQV